MTLRSLCQGSEELLFLEEPIDEYSKEIPLEDTSPKFTKRYLTSFRETPEDESKVVLQDRQQSGWLAWGHTLEVARFTGWDEPLFPVEEASLPGKEMIGKFINEESWWKRVSLLSILHVDILMVAQLASLWAQENERNYPSATHIDFILALSQLYGPFVFRSIRPIVEGYLAEMESTKVYDRHKTRAMWEFLAGVLRGSMEWSGKDRKDFWDWFTPRLPELHGNIRHDTIKSVQAAQLSDI